MRYALLLYAEVEAAKASTHERAAAELARYGRITQALADEAVLRGGEAFLPASTAHRVRSADGSTLVEDVPEGDVELGGFVLVECDEDRALEIAALLPVSTHGHVEVRPLMELPPPT